MWICLDEVMQTVEQFHFAVRGTLSDARGACVLVVCFPMFVLRPTQHVRTR